MPKLKTHKATAKRVRVTKTGKLLRGNGGTHHKLTTQTIRNKRSKRVDSPVTGRIARNLKRALGK